MAISSGVSTASGSVIAVVVVEDKEDGDEELSDETAAGVCEMRPSGSSCD